MKTQLLSTAIIVALLCLTSLKLFSQVSTAPSTGNGTSDAPYQISTLENLYWLSQNPDEFNKYFIQTNNIDATDTKNWNDGKGWSPIGGTNKFNGFYNGQGYEIFGLNIDRPDENNIGLFGHVGHVSSTSEATEIKNLGLKNANITGGRGTGTLIGRVTGNENTIIEYCYAINSKVAGDGATGGLVGSHNSFQETPGGTNNPIIRHSFANVEVILKEGAEGDKDKFGGLVGCTQKGTIINSFAKGSITVDGATRIGGLAGCADYRGEVNSCYASAIVNATNSTNVGGLVGNTVGAGANDGKIEKSFWDVDVSGLTVSAGGTGATGKTTEEMKDETTYTEWDMGNVWGISMEINDGYPYILYNDSPLPITLLSFNAYVDKENVIIKWTTGSEINNNYFTVEKTIDGINFDVVEYIHGAGNSNELKNYSIIDKSPYLGVSYYRLKQTDFDGSSESFPLTYVNFLSNDDVNLSVYPNPSNNQSFTINIDNPGDGMTKIMLMNLQGEIIEEKLYKTEHNNSLTICEKEFVSQLSQGIYIVSAKGLNFNKSKKLIIIR